MGEFKSVFCRDEDVPEIVLSAEGEFLDFFGITLEIKFFCVKETIYNEVRFKFDMREFLFDFIIEFPVFYLTQVPSYPPGTRKNKSQLHIPFFILIILSFIKSIIFAKNDLQNITNTFYQLIIDDFHHFIQTRIIINQISEITIKQFL